MAPIGYSWPWGKLMLGKKLEDKNLVTGFL
jgi:hypothetical protein